MWMPDFDASGGDMSVEWHIAIQRAWKTEGSHDPA
jgi:hypothetical protein